MKSGVTAIGTALRQPDTRRAAENFAWLIADKLVRLALGVAVGLLVARYLGPERFGLLGYAVAVSSMFAILSEAGLESIVRRDIAADASRSGRVLTAAAACRGSIALVSYLMLLAVWFLGWGESSGRDLLPVMGLVIFQPLLFLPDLWFQARLRSRVTVVIQWISAALGALARVMLVRMGAGLEAFAWIAIVEMALGAGLLFWRARNDGLLWGQLQGIGAEAWRLGREAWPLFLSGIAVAFYMRIDFVMLRQMAGEREVGIYMAGMKFSEIWLFAPGALAASMILKLTRARAAGGARYQREVCQYLKISALLGYALALPTFLFGPSLVSWAYGAAFVDAMPVLMVLAWILLFASLGVARGQVCVLEGWTRFHLLATLAGALLNVGLNWVLIPSFGSLGAAMATLAAQIVAAWLSTYFFRPARALAWMQTRALLFPFPSLRYDR